MIRLMGEKDEIKVVNDQVGSPTYAADLAELIMKIITDSHTSTSNWKAGIYNFSNEGIISWYDFAQAIKEIIACPCDVKPVTTADYPTPAKRPAYSVLDKTKIQQAFAMQLKNWKESLAVCLRKTQLD
jgi:dTDP-4-dehydrorhamnose reductase